MICSIVSGALSTKAISGISTPTSIDCERNWKTIPRILIMCSPSAGSGTNLTRIREAAGSEREPDAIRRLLLGDDVLLKPPSRADSDCDRAFVWLLYQGSESRTSLPTNQYPAR